VAPGERRPRIAPLVALVALAAAHSASADEPGDSTSSTLPTGRARLVYTVEPAAQPCPSTDELRAAIEARVGHAVFAEPATVTVNVVVRRDGPTYVATVALPDAPGERGATRELRTEAGCAELASAAALVASIAVDPASALRPPPPPPPPPPAPPASRTWRALFGLGPRGAWGLTPDLVLGATLSGAAVSSTSSWGAALEGFAANDTTVSPGSIGIRPVALAFLPCRLGAHWEACGVAKLGLLRGAGDGFDRNYATWKAFAGLGGRGGAFVDLGRMRLRASIEAIAVLPRTEFLIGETTAYATRGVSLAAGLDALIAIQ
jgi:hypothetical protein